MTIKELKELLEQFPDHLTVMIPASGAPFCVMARNISRGVNELDGLLFIDDYKEDDE